jgi:hypothetical protein
VRLVHGRHVRQQHGHLVQFTPAKHTRSVQFHSPTAKNMYIHAPEERTA